MNAEPEIPKSYSDRLLRIADLVDEEARSWCDGFAIYDPETEQFRWSKEYPEQHARWIRLKSASEFLRTLAKRAKKKESQ